MKFFEFIIKRVIPWYTALGITTRTVTLEVIGRKSGIPIKVSLSRTKYNNNEYFVSLAGEVNWVKNVRAASGKAVILSRKRIPVILSEINEEERPPILLAYVQSRAFTHSGEESARLFFNLEAKPTLEDMKKIAGRYVVFRINYQ